MKRIKTKNVGGWGKLCLVLFMGCIGLQQAMAAAEVWVSDERGNDATGAGTNDVGGVAAVVLHDGEDLSFAWSMSKRSAPRRGNVRVTGAGTLTLTHNGETFASFTASDGVAEFTLPAAWLDAFAFAFEGEGSADLFGFAAPVGTALSFR